MHRALLFLAPALLAAQNTYRLESVELDQPVIWGAQLTSPGHPSLAFGGQHQQADDGRPHTRLLVDGTWQRIDHQLRANNPLQSLHTQTLTARNAVRDALSTARANYLRDQPTTPDLLQKPTTLLGHLIAALPDGIAAPYHNTQLKFARPILTRSLTSLASHSDLTPASVRSLHQVQIDLEIAAECFDAEPPPRALHCGAPKTATPAPPAQPLVYDPHTRRYVLFAGDHLDYLTNDTWTFDPAVPQWRQQHPPTAPAPRANHHLEPLGDGTLRLTGGYTYTSDTDYLGAPFRDLDDGDYVYHIATATWTAGENAAPLVPPTTRTYRTGALHPDHFLTGEKPDARAFSTWLNDIPTNTWVATDPPHRPQLNRDWGTARLDPDRDLLLRWSGGHSAHGGTDVPHFHFATNRWELPFPVEFPLGQLYANTSYPDGFNFNHRPWVTGHTYQNYAYDRVGKTMVFAGRPKHHYRYDPDIADWVDRGAKPQAMTYNSCFYTLTLTSTPSGIYCWDKNAKIHHFLSGENRWTELPLTGAPLPGAYVDNSSLVYDPNRHRLLAVNTAGYGKPYSGQLWSIDPGTGHVTALTPAGHAAAHHFATVDKSCYHPTADLLVLGTYLKNATTPHTPTPAYDPKANRWVTLDLNYPTSERSGNPVRHFPHTRSDAIVHDPKRDLLWGVDTRGQVYVLRLDLKTADVQPLQ